MVAIPWDSGIIDPMINDKGQTMTKHQAIVEHIALREAFWGKYSPIRYGYGYVRCLFHKQSLIESASEGLRHYIATYGTAAKLNASL